jgi:glycosyltransferase involved in cell wall biosynthesis
LELHLWGRGDCLEVLQDRAEALGIDDRVFFHGMVPVEELSLALVDMDLGVVPNRKSAATDLMLPVKLMEYIALGIPVVAPKLKAIEYYFTDEMVSLFEPENVDAMAEAILRMYRDDLGRKLQSEMAKAFLQEYGWEKQSQDFINYYLGV